MTITPAKCPSKEELAKSKDVYIYLSEETIEFTVLVKDDANPTMTILQGNNAPKKGEQSYDKKSTALRDAGWKDLKNGAYQFCDRDFTFSNVPEELIGCKYWEGSCKAMGIDEGYSYWIKTGRCCGALGKSACAEGDCSDGNKEEVKLCDWSGKKNNIAFSNGWDTSKSSALSAPVKEGICDDPKMVKFAGQPGFDRLRLKVTTTGTVHVLIPKGAKYVDGRPKTPGGLPTMSQLFTLSTMQGEAVAPEGCLQRDKVAWIPKDIDGDGKYCTKGQTTNGRADGTPWCQTETEPAFGSGYYAAGNNPRETGTVSTIENFSTSNYPNNPGFDVITQPALCTVLSTKGTTGGTDSTGGTAT